MHPVRRLLPGLALVAAAVAIAFAIAEVVEVSTLVLGVALGAIAANTAILRPALVPGVDVAGRQLLRAGIVLLGLRLSFDEVRDLGVAGVVAVVIVVASSFVGIQLLARAVGLSHGFGLLVATGYSICGASAIAAMQPLSDADEEETAYAIGLVALCGTLSILVLPFLGNLMDLTDATFGAWAGAGVHDVGQVTATASAYSDEALAPATLVKLTRVLLLAPMVLGVGLLVRRRRRAERAARTRRASAAGAAVDGDADVDVDVPIVPLFVVGFLAAIGLRATGWLSDGQLATARDLEQLLLTAAMFGLGTGVVIARLRRLGGRPLVFGLASWAGVAATALAAAVVIA